MGTFVHYYISTFESDDKTMTRQDDDRRHGQWKYSMPQGRVWARGPITQRYWDNPITKETNWGVERILAMQI